MLRFDSSAQLDIASGNTDFHELQNTSEKARNGDYGKIQLGYAGEIYSFLTK